MESLWKLFCFATLFFAGGFVLQPAHAQDCVITIIGNEVLIDRVQQDITCIANCRGVINSIQWLLDFPGQPLQYTSDESGADELVLSLNPALELDGDVFICRVTTATNTYEKNITIAVKELEHSLEIVPSQSNPVVAGNALTLTCVAVASRLPHLQWADQDGNTIITSSDITVSQLEETDNATVTMVTITFNPLKTSHAALYTCNCEIIHPSSFASTDYILEVKIPPPTVTVTRYPPAPRVLYTGDSLDLTCEVQISVCVDTDVIVKKWWHKIGSGPVLHDPPRVNVSSVKYSSYLTFNDIISSDTGIYECSVQVCPAGTLYVNDSISVTESVDIPASLEVEINIEYEPPCDYTHSSPPYYRPCSSISFSCDAYGASGGLTYVWTSSNGASFVTGSTTQTVTAEILTYSDGGVHTCCAYDGEGNSGCDKTEMVMKGNGIYIDESEYIDDVGIPDNDIVVPQTGTCIVDIYCCSDTTVNTMTIEFPNGDIKETADDYYNIYVEQLATARIRAYSVESFYPQQLGLYTCNIGDDISTSVAMYSSLPGAPRVYDGVFSCNEDPAEDYVLSITCQTSDSPPTKVEWCRNGEIIDINGGDYEAVQIVTDRINMYFDNVLYVKNPCFAAGIHDFECKIINSQGSDSHTVQTNVPVYIDDSTEIVAEGSNFDGDIHALTCIVTLPEKLKDLLPFIEMEWVGPPGVALTEQNHIFISEPNITNCSIMTTLLFNPLKTNHAGLYRCILGISKPALASFFEREIRHEVIVITRALFQIHFGPIPNCMEWDSDLAYALEDNIKRDMVDAINERCQCDFTEDLIDMGEMSCHYSRYTAVYRARLTAMIYTAKDLLAMVEDWIQDDGTFVFCHNYTKRLRMNPKCPLMIDSYLEPECGLSVEDINEKLFS